MRQKTFIRHERERKGSEPLRERCFWSNGIKAQQLFFVFTAACRSDTGDAPNSKPNRVGVGAAFFGTASLLSTNVVGIGLSVRVRTVSAAPREAHQVFLPLQGIPLPFLNKGVDSLGEWAAAAAVASSCRRQSSVWGECKELWGNELWVLTENFSVTQNTKKAKEGKRKCVDKQKADLGIIIFSALLRN